MRRRRATSAKALPAGVDKRAVPRGASLDGRAKATAHPAQLGELAIHPSQHQLEARALGHARGSSRIRLRQKVNHIVETEAHLTKRTDEANTLHCGHSVLTIPRRSPNRRREDATTLVEANRVDPNAGNLRNLPDFHGEDLG